MKTATQRRTRGKAHAESEAELDKTTSATKRAADEIGIQEFSLDVLTAFGVPGTPPIYGQIVETLAEVAKVYGVSERTVASWRSRGMPGESGCFSINHIERWRRVELQDAPRLRREQAISSDLVRAAFDYLEGETKFWLISVMEDALQSGLMTDGPYSQLGQRFAETRGRVYVPIELRKQMLVELADIFQPPTV